VRLYPDICPLCKKAAEMEKNKQKGHVLRVRNDTGEHCHDFKDGNRFIHGYCLATERRKNNG
jgi:hypothetical protein